MHSTAVRNPNSTPEDDRIKWMRVQEVFAQHYAHEEAERKKKAGEPEQRTQKDPLELT